MGFRLLVFICVRGIYVKVLLNEPLSELIKPSLCGFYTLVVSKFATCMYVQVLLNGSFRSRHKHSSWWILHLACFISTTCIPKSFSLNHLGEDGKPPLGGFDTLLVSICATCMRKSPSLNHYGRHRQRPLGGLDTLLVSICATRMPKSSSLNHLGQHIQPRLCGFHSLLVSNSSTCMSKSKPSSNQLCCNRKPLLGGFHTFLVSNG